MNLSLGFVPPETPEALTIQIAKLRSEFVRTSDELLLQDVGLYEYTHPLDDAVSYKDRLKELQAQLKECVRKNDAVTCADRWTLNGDLRQGARMLRDLGKLMLRAYNTEADNVIRTLRPHRRDAAVARLDKLRDNIAKLGSLMQLAIADAYHDLRLREVELTADFLAKKAEEKEQARELRAQMREEAAVQRELARERERLEKERHHYLTALLALRERGDESAASEASRKLGELDTALQGITDREANIRAGYVYVISNVGAFGPGVVKIGLTRRLEPLDRIRELGGASVPYRFDVHALIFSADAVALERQLHERFSDRRMNLVNRRREFFSVSPHEVKLALVDLAGDLLSFNEQVEALEWRQSERLRTSSSLVES